MVQPESFANGFYYSVSLNIYTEDEDLSEADIVVTSLGEPEGKKGMLKKADKELEFNGVLTVDQLLKYFST